MGVCGRFKDAISMNDNRMQRLQSFARMESPIDPDTLAEAVSAMCVEDAAPLGAAEAALAHEILIQVYRSVQADMRRMLAERFATRSDAPHALVVALANDTIEIARPIIRLSPVLGDEDLVRVVVDGSRDHRLAVTERPALSARLCDVLVYLGDADIAVRVASHPHAVVSAHALQRLVLASRETAALQPILLRRPEMRDDLAAAMYHWVADDLKAFIAEHYGEALARHLGPDVDAAASSMRRPAISANDDIALPPAVAKLVQALRRGDMLTAELEMQRLTRLPEFAVSRLLYNDTGEGLAIVCRASSVDQTTFGEIFALLHADGPAATFIESKAFNAAVAYYKHLTLRQADLILDGWRISPRSVWGDAGHTNAAWSRRRTAPDA
ncbi:MAG: hypothetical protein VR70_15085 [Rhodospirillaceae bacterium BRH_c57]|nr:MAG: hypothetical protein VR70_15085 [Rhodospirillaceae bacterium BRH_c57]